MSETGAIVEETRPPRIEETFELFRSLFSADGGAAVTTLLRDAGTTQAHPLMRQALEIQRAHAKSIAEFAALVGRLDQFRRAMLSFMEERDVILCPVCAFAGMAHGTTYNEERFPAFSYTMTFNLTGWPAAVVRAGTSREGLPIGVQIAARPWREDVALAVAQHLESELGGWQSPPR